MNTFDEYKLSHYIVVTDIIDDPTLDSDKRVLLATRTAKVLIVRDWIFQKISQESWDEIPSEIFSKLLEIKAVVPRGENELLAIMDRNNSAIEGLTTLYHVIQPTAMCQLGCDYCGQSHSKSYISADVGTRILERIESKFLNRDFRKISISWFGAEPLIGLAQIRDLTPKLLALADKHNCGYTAKVVTNGLSLKEHVFLELVKKHKVTKIEVTLDGIAEFHDRRRHTKAGLSSFDLIMKNLLAIFNREDFHDLGCSISIRCNVDERNEGGVIPLIELLASYNLQDKIEYFYVARVYSWGNDAHLLSHEKEDFGAKEIDWLVAQYQNGFKPKFLPGPEPVVCLSVTPNAEVFDAFGNVFDCTETPYVDAYADSEFVLGNVSSGLASISARRPLLNFNHEVAEGSYPCSTCKMLPVCGGGCPKSWKEGRNACPSTKFNIKDKLILAYAIKKGGIGILHDSGQEYEWN